jgi:glycosyltransferase involved in cell wall biosynthesis
LAEGLAARWDVRVLAQRPGGFEVAEAPGGIVLRTVELGMGTQAWGVVGAPAWPLQVGLHRQRALLRAVAEELEEFRPDVVVPVLSRLGSVLGVLGEVPGVVDLIDSLALNMRRRAEREKWLWPLFAWEARRMARWERRVVAAARRATVVAERDRSVLIGGERRLADRVVRVPLGLEVPADCPDPTPGQGVLLAGNLGYFPTIDGAKWFARRVWPQVKERLPGAEWWLAGARPARSIRRLGRLDGVRVWPDPEDLGQLRRRAAVAVAPLIAGSGTPIKVLEAFADGIPVVATPRAAEGLDRPTGAELITVDNAAGFADAIVELLGDSEMRERRGRAGFDWVRRHHDSKVVTERFEQVLLDALQVPADSSGH